VVDDEGEEDDNDTGRLSDLIAIADDDTFFTQAAVATDEAEAAYYRRQADRANVGEPSHMKGRGERLVVLGRRWSGGRLLQVTGRSEQCRWA
jgi:hypothetical protein